MDIFCNGISMSYSERWVNLKLFILYEINEFTKSRLHFYKAIGILHGIYASGQID